jgi:hypothetical protein
MDEIIAALILACTSLTHGDSNFDAQRKAACVQRVSTCAAPMTNHFSGDLGRTKSILLDCSKEVHL